MQSELTHVVPFSMGELFEGSHGLACSICNERGSMLWLTVEELQTLPDGDARNYVCENKLGAALCREHQPPLENVVYRDGE
jgi:hypothetical protein